MCVCVSASASAYGLTEALWKGPLSHESLEAVSYGHQALTDEGGGRLKDFLLLVSEKGSVPPPGPRSH